KGDRHQRYTWQERGDLAVAILDRPEGRPPPADGPADAYDASGLRSSTAPKGDRHPSPPGHARAT
ncbi:hypothetical protein, partial [Streptomyces scopuliridis]|uniref:hypothetical protein n=1 Tax=Streptomyces scopuliridis TaxID=452529 RepID=UPI0036C43AE0